MNDFTEDVWYIEITTVHNKTDKIKTYKTHLKDRLKALSYCIIFNKANEEVIDMKIYNELRFKL